MLQCNHQSLLPSFDDNRRPLAVLFSIAQVICEHERCRQFVGEEVFFFFEVEVVVFGADVFATREQDEVAEAVDVPAVYLFSREELSPPAIKRGPLGQDVFDAGRLEVVGYAALGTICVQAQQDVAADIVQGINIAVQDAIHLFALYSGELEWRVGSKKVLFLLDGDEQVAVAVDAFVGWDAADHKAYDKAFEIFEEFDDCALVMAVVLYKVEERWGYPAIIIQLIQPFEQSIDCFYVDRFKLFRLLRSPGIRALIAGDSKEEVVAKNFLDWVLRPMNCHPAHVAISTLHSIFTVMYSIAEKTYLRQ